MIKQLLFMSSLDLIKWITIGVLGIIILILIFRLFLLQKKFVRLQSLFEKNEKYIKKPSEDFDLQIKSLVEQNVQVFTKTYIYYFDSLTEKYHFVNKQPPFMSFLGDPKHFTYNEIKKVIHPIDEQPIVPTLLRMESDDIVNTLSTMQIRFKNELDEYDWYEVRFFRLLNEKTPNKKSLRIGMLINIQDLKERELKIIKERDLARQSNTIKSAFITNMGHEIRTSLNSIVGFSSLLAKIAELDEEEANQYANVIQNDSEKLLNLVNNILDYSNLESGAVKFVRKPTSIPILIYEELKLIKEEFSKNLSLQIKPSSFIRHDEIISAYSKGEYKLPKAAVALEQRKRDGIVDTDDIRLAQVIHNLFITIKENTKEGTVVLAYSFTPLNNLEIDILFKGNSLLIEEQKQLINNIYKPSIFKYPNGFMYNICMHIIKELKGDLTITIDDHKTSCIKILLPIQ